MAIRKFGKKELTEVLKKHGLDIAEETAAAVAKGVLNALPEVLELTPNKFDDLLIPLIEVIRPKIMELIDKIDGEDDL